MCLHPMIASPIFTQGMLTAVLAGNMNSRHALTTLRALGVTPTYLLAAIQIFPSGERNTLRMVCARHHFVLPSQATLPPRSAALPYPPPLSGRSHSGNRRAASRCA